MSTPSGRSVKISDDERGAWSSDRPRREGGARRPADLSVRCRVLAPADRLRYSPGSLVVVVSGSPEQRDSFAERVVEDRGALLSLGKVRRVLAGRVADDELEDRAGELLDAAVGKRLRAGDSVVVLAEGLTAEERERFVRPAAAARRPRHIIFVEASRDQVAEEDRPALNELRRALDAGQLGAEGFQTALRLGGATIAEVKRIVFRPPPQDD
jgi:hypothetical protein